MARIETGAGRGVKAHRRPAQPRPTQPRPPQSARRRRGSPPKAGRCGSVERAETVEKTGIEGLAVIDRKIDLAVAEALERLAQSAQADRPLAPHAVDVDLQGDHLLRGAGLMQHVAGGADEDRTPHPAGAKPVDVDPIALVLGRGRPAHGELDIAVEGIGQSRMQDDLRAHGGQGPRRLGKPHVVADRDAEAPDVRHVEDDELAAGRGRQFIGAEGKHLPVAGDHLAAGVDHRGRVEDPPLLLLEEGAGQKPDAVTRGHRLEGGLGRARQGLGMLRQGAEGRELAEDDHLDPGVAGHQQIELLAHGRQILLERADRHLEAGDGKGRHGIMGVMGQRASLGGLQVACPAA